MNGVTAMKFLEIVRFELVYQLRRRSTWFVFALFLFPLIGVTNDDLIDARNREILFHAPFFIAESSVIMSLIALLVLAGVAGDAATRDVQTRLEPLMHAAPVGRAAYVGGRFLGAFAVAAMLLAVVPLVHMLLPLFHPGLEAEIVGPFRPAAYLQAYFLLIVPNAFVATALMFALATLVRHTLGSYAGAALVLAGAQFSGDFVGGTLGRWDLAKMLDSTGAIALEVMTRTWSPVELNERLIGSEGALLWNRLVWLAIAFAVLVLTYRRFHLGANAGAVGWWQRGRLRAAGLAGRPAAGARAGGFEGAVAQRSAPVAVPRVPREFGAAGRVRQTLTIARDSLREVATGWSWLVLPFLALLIALNLEALNSMGAGTPVLPTTGRVLETVGDMPPPIILIILMLPVLFAGEVVWRERDANMHALADAAPVPDWVPLVGKLLGLWLLIVAFHGLLMLTGVVSQVVLGWYDFDFALYFQVLFGLRLVDALVFALFALSVHVLVNQKHVGHLLVLLLVLGPLTLAELLGIDHPLLVLGSEPSWRHSPISGFGPFVGPVLWFELYWAAWALLLALVARLFWVRGVERGMGERVRIARRRFTGQAVGAFGAVLGLVLLVGGFIFYNTNTLNAYHRTAEGPQRQAEYERLYGRYEGVPQPQMTATELDVELYPDRREAGVRGVLHLVNRTARPIDTIHVAVSSQVETGEIEFGRPARAALVDDDLGHRIYVLDEPLQPGDSLRLSWQVRHAPRGFPARGISTAVVGNGSFIVMPTWTPLIGYQPRRELAGAGERREHGLPARPAVPSLYDLQARRDPAGHERIDLEVTVGTAADQVAVAPGELLRAWTRDGRRYFHYATAAPIGNEYAIFSARYAVREARWGDPSTLREPQGRPDPSTSSGSSRAQSRDEQSRGAAGSGQVVALEILHHPAHDLNVQRMIRSMEASLEQFTERFGPYPYAVLRMVEYPAQAARCMPRPPASGIRNSSRCSTRPAIRAGSTCRSPWWRTRWRISFSRRPRVSRAGPCSAKASPGTPRWASSSRSMAPSTWRASSGSCANPT